MYKCTAVATIREKEKKNYTSRGVVAQLYARGSASEYKYMQISFPRRRAQKIQVFSSRVAKSFPWQERERNIQRVSLVCVAGSSALPSHRREAVSPSLFALSTSLFREIFPFFSQAGEKNC